MVRDVAHSTGRRPYCSWHALVPGVQRSVPLLGHATGPYTPTSIRMKLPVVRLASYGSKTSGRAVDTVTVPTWFSSSASLTSAVTVRVVCFSR